MVDPIDIEELIGCAFQSGSLRMNPNGERALDRIAAFALASRRAARKTARLVLREPRGPARPGQGEVRRAHPRAAQGPAAQEPGLGGEEPRLPECKGPRPPSREARGYGSQRRMTMHTSTIDWHSPAEKLPDDDLLVLLAGGDSVMGFLDGDSWRDETAMPINAPAWWAHIPAGPEA